MGGEPRDALDLRPGVWLSVPRGAVAVVLLALAKVDTARQFADDIEVGTAADVSFQGRDVDERLRGKVARPQIAEGAQLFAESEEPLFWPNGAGAPFWATNSAKEDRIS